IAPPQIKETQLPHRTAPIGQIQRDSLNLICWPRGRGIFRDAHRLGNELFDIRRWTILDVIRSLASASVQQSRTNSHNYPKSLLPAEYWKSSLLSFLADQETSGL
ncbi:MAG: hypothetical protein ACR2KT_16345, partial [Methylocella sp.]